MSGAAGGADDSKCVAYLRRELRAAEAMASKPAPARRAVTVAVDDSGLAAQSACCAASTAAAAAVTCASASSAEAGGGDDDRCEDGEVIKSLLEGVRCRRDHCAAPRAADARRCTGFDVWAQ